jgi:hypothetical protein
VRLNAKVCKDVHLRTKHRLLAFDLSYLASLNGALQESP